jgi:hypothetical protein
MSTAQNVELETANIQIESQRGIQASNEVAASKESATLAQINADDAQQRIANYNDFAHYADVLFDTESDSINPFNFPDDVSEVFSKFGFSSMTAL